MKYQFHKEKREEKIMRINEVKETREVLVRTEYVA